MKKLLRRAARWVFAQWGRLNRFPSETWQDYPQTWGLDGWRRPSSKLCGWLIGHEISRTETSYAGGGWCTKYCRWCNRSIYVPARESYFAEYWSQTFEG